MLEGGEGNKERGPDKNMSFNIISRNAQFSLAIKLSRFKVVFLVKCKEIGGEKRNIKNVYIISK